MKKVILLLCILISLGNVYSQKKQSELFVGTAKVNITPTDSISLAGYPSYFKRTTNKIHDSLYCRTTVFKVVNKKIVLLSLDLCGFYSKTSDYLRKAIIDRFKLGPDELFLSATHTHSGPAITIREERKNTINYKYTQKLKDLIIKCIENAMANMTSCKIEAKNGYSPIGINRRIFKLNPKEWPFDNGFTKMGRNPNGIVDNEVLVLKITGNDSDFKSCLYDYACHNRSQDAGSKTISGDFFGISEQLIEKILGGGMVASAFAGASGDIDPIYVLDKINKEENWTPELELMGTLLGQEVIRTYRRANNEIKINNIKSAITTLKLQRRKGKEYVSNDSLPKRDLNITIASMGDIAFIGLGCEALVEVGLEIKKASPFKYNFIITHCNGAAGYLAPKELYNERGYEVTYSPFGPEAADIVIKKTLEMLYKQYKY